MEFKPGDTFSLKTAPGNSAIATLRFADGMTINLNLPYGSGVEIQGLAQNLIVEINSVTTPNSGLQVVKGGGD